MRLYFARTPNLAAMVELLQEQFICHRHRIDKLCNNIVMSDNCALRMPSIRASVVTALHTYLNLSATWQK